MWALYKVNYIYSLLQNLNILLFQFLSDKIIYQSIFVKKFGVKILKKSVVIYNASQPNFRNRVFKKKIKPILISVEGSIDSAFNASNLINSIDKDYQYEIYGKVSKDLKNKFIKKKNIKFHGQVPRKDIKIILKKNKKYIFISLEMFQLVQFCN